MCCRREYAILNLMLLIYEDKRKRIIKNQEEIKFSSSSAYHLIILTVRAKAEKQISNSSTDDEDLIVRIDEKKFPQLGSNRLVDSPAAFSGGTLQNLAKTVYFLVSLNQIGHISYSYPADKISPEVKSREESIFWGVRWLYHKAQYLLENDNRSLSIPYVRKWRSWKEAVRSYNANPDLVENYVKEVFLVYEKGVDLEGNTLW